jgi:hypothetical protein
VRDIGIQQTQPAVYEALTKDLTADEQNMITSVFHEAQQKEEEARAAAAAAAAGGVDLVISNGA